MTKNPKIEFFKVNLYPTPSHSDVTFRDVFINIFLVRLTRFITMTKEEEKLSMLNQNQSMV